MTDAPILTLEGVAKSYGRTQALADVDVALAAGVSVGIVGASGSGKSTLAGIAAGLTRPDHGTVRVDGKDVTAARGTVRRAWHRRVQMVFQDPGGSLNPRHKIGRIVAAPARILCGLSRDAAQHRAGDLLTQVGLDPSLLDRYPHELSGGQAQRVAIARCLAAQPDVLILDEPTSALDVTVQAQVLRLLDRLRRDFGLAFLFVSHDLAVVEAMCDRVVVLSAGRAVETGTTQQVFAAPRDRYTQELLSAVPIL